MEITFDLLRKKSWEELPEEVVENFLRASPHMSKYSIIDTMREEYVRNIDMGKFFPYVNSVEYDDDPSRDFPCARCIIPEKNAKGLKSDIRVYPPAFTLCKNEQEFLSIVRDHEGRHAEQIYKWPERYRTKPLFGLFSDPDASRKKYIRERDAWHEQQRRAREAGVSFSEEFVQHSRSLINGYRGTARGDTPNNKLRKDIDR